MNHRATTRAPNQAPSRPPRPHHRRPTNATLAVTRRAVSPAHQRAVLHHISTRRPSLDHLCPSLWVLSSANIQFGRRHDQFPRYRHTAVFSHNSHLSARRRRLGRRINRQRCIFPNSRKYVGRTRVGRPSSHPSSRKPRLHDGDASRIIDARTPVDQFDDRIVLHGTCPRSAAFRSTSPKKSSGSAVEERQ